MKCWEQPRLAKQPCQYYPFSFTKFNWTLIFHQFTNLHIPIELSCKLLSCFVFLSFSLIWGKRTKSSENLFLQASVVQETDSTIHWIKCYPAYSAIGFLNTFRWIVIYPVDSSIPLVPGVFFETFIKHRQLNNSNHVADREYFFIEPFKHYKFCVNYFFARLVLALTGQSI